MKHITLQPRPLNLQTTSGASMLATDEQDALVATLTLGECQTIDLLVAQECLRRGWGFVRVGGRRYCAVERLILADLAANRFDLFEVRAQIEEARFEA